MTTLAVPRSSSNSAFTHAIAAIEEPITTSSWGWTLDALPKAHQPRPVLSQNAGQSLLFHHLQIGLTFANTSIDSSDADDDVLPLLRRTLTSPPLSTEPNKQFADATAPLRTLSYLYFEFAYRSKRSVSATWPKLLAEKLSSSEAIRTRIEQLRELVLEEGGVLSNTSVGAFARFWTKTFALHMPSIVATEEGMIVAAWRHSTSRLLRLEFISDDLIRYTAFTPSARAPGGSRKEAGLLTSAEILEDTRLLALMTP